MSLVRTPDPIAPVGGLVGPEAPSDPQDRLRQLLVAGARETQRQQRKALSTGSGCRKLPATLRRVHNPLQRLPDDPELAPGYVRFKIRVGEGNKVLEYPEAEFQAAGTFTYSMMNLLPESRWKPIRAALNAYIETNNLKDVVPECNHTTGSQVIRHLLALKPCLADWETLFFAGMEDLVMHQSATVLPSATRTAGGSEIFAYDIRMPPFGNPPS